MAESVTRSYDANAILETPTEKEGVPRDDRLSYLPERPEEPLQSDCCGTGCTPCVFDIYQEELDEWLTQKAMTPQERVEWRMSKLGVRTGTSSDSPGALSPSEYHTFAVERVKQITSDSVVFTFRLPVGQRLGLHAGQHAVVR